MRLTTKLSGLCASGAFMVVGVFAFLQQMDPLPVFLYGLPAAIIAGALGYWMGNICAHPKGDSASSGKSKKKGTQSTRPITGNEVFLEGQ